MLTPIAPDVWGVEHDLYMPGGLHFPVRMTVIRLPDGGLWLHAPVPIDDVLAGELEALGPVRHLVAPNALHHLYFGDAAARYPDAKTWAAPTLAEKRSDLSFDGTLDDDSPPWVDVIDGIFVHGIPWCSETVFLHRPSKTLLVTDLFFNMQRPANRRSRFFFWLLGVLGRPKQSPILKMQTKDKAAAAASGRRILEWGFERAVPAHGPVVEADAQRVVAAVLGPMIARGGLALPAP